MAKEQTSIPTTGDFLKVNIPYFQAPNAIFELEQVTGKSELLILLYLCRCGNQGAKAFPSYQTIGTKCRMSRKWAIETVKILVKLKLLTKEVTPYKSNTYTINLPSELTSPPSELTSPPSELTSPYKKLSIKNHNKEPVTTGGENGLNNHFKIYEDNIGMLTPLIAEKIKDIASEYPPEWFEEAVKKACEANIRRLNYITAILERWKVEGFQSTRSQGRARGVERGQRASDRPSRYEVTEPVTKKGETQ